MNERVMIAVDAERLDRLEAAMRELAARLDGATIQPAPQWVDRCTACARLDVSHRTLDRMVQDGRVRARGAGKARRFLVQPLG